MRLHSNSQNAQEAISQLITAALPLPASRWGLGNLRPKRLPKSERLNPGEDSVLILMAASPRITNWALAQPMVESFLAAIRTTGEASFTHRRRLLISGPAMPL